MHADRLICKLFAFTDGEIFVTAFCAGLMIPLWAKVIANEFSGIVAGI